VSIIFGQDLSEKFVLGVVDGLDDVLVVARKIEEATTLAGRAQFGQNILAGEGHQVISRIESELGTKVSKDPRRIVLEFEIVFCGRY